ncbi:hypothetical protein [Brevundimonas naejangsanensis]|uniref:hypothetical protein n=1 Tax=Brevundimonas naejangsanensis TaxID=588932 RepID=UPI0039F6B13F
MKMPSPQPNFAIAWWSAADYSAQATAILAVATFLVGLIGFVGITWQIGRQAKNAINQNRLNEASKLKLEIYKGILETCELASSAEIALSSYLRNFQLEIRTAGNLHAMGRPFNTPTARFLELSELRQAATVAAIGVITVVERWHVVDGRMSIFQDAINSAIYDVNEAADLVQALAIRLMPMDDPGTTNPLPWNLPTGAEAKQLKASADLFYEALHNLGYYVADFQTEMQALLVGDLFGNGVITREPLNPSAKVIRLKDERALRRYFRQETSWGKATALLMADVAAQYPAKGELSRLGFTPFGIRLVREQAAVSKRRLKRMGLRP